jgi:hypothetical protein
VVGDHAVLLLRHGLVERAEAGLHVGQRNTALGRHQRTGQRGGGVAVHQHGVGLLVAHHVLEPLHHDGDLAHGRAGPHVERVVRAGDAQLVEEQVGQLRVVVLARVHEDLLALGAECDAEGGGLHELRPVPDQGDDAHGGS